MGFSRQEYWSGLPFPSSGDLPDPGIEPMSPVLAGRLFTSESPGTPTLWADVKIGRFSRWALPNHMSLYFIYSSNLYNIYLAALGPSCSPEACQILAPQPGIKPTSLALEGSVLTTGPLEKAPHEPLKMESFLWLSQKEWSEIWVWRMIW